VRYAEKLLLGYLFFIKPAPPILWVLTDRSESCGEDDGEGSFWASGDAAEEAATEMPRRRRWEQRRLSCGAGWHRDWSGKKAGAEAAWSKQADDAMLFSLGLAVKIPDAKR
jgi:hypothetical protein